MTKNKKMPTHVAAQTAVQTLPQTAPRKATARVFEAEDLPIQSLRLIAAPDPKDDLTADEIATFAKKASHSPELIQQLIDYLKTL